MRSVAAAFAPEMVREMRWLARHAPSARSAQATERARAVGWCLGVLAEGAGAGLLLARREREGLRWTIECAARIAERSRARLEVSADVPELAAAAQPALCWIAAAVLWPAAAALPARGVLGVRFEDDGGTARIVADRASRSSAADIRAWIRAAGVPIAVRRRRADIAIESPADWWSGAGRRA